MRETDWDVLLLPAGVVAIGSGLFFGLWWGFLLNLLGNVGGAAVAFFLSRKVGRAWFTRRFLQQPRWVALDGAIERHGWKIIFLSQVHPLFPTSLLNYLYGVTRIRFGEPQARNIERGHVAEAQDHYIRKLLRSLVASASFSVVPNRNGP